MRWVTLSVFASRMWKETIRLTLSLIYNALKRNFLFLDKRTICSVVLLFNYFYEFSHFLGTDKIHFCHSCYTTAKNPNQTVKALLITSQHFYTLGSHLWICPLPFHFSLLSALPYSNDDAPWIFFWSTIATLNPSVQVDWFFQRVLV